MLGLLPVTLLLAIYNFAINFASLFLNVILNNRIKSGKEDANRIDERFGKSDIKRPDGRLVWFHGASVGETMIGLNLADQLRVKDSEIKFLFTSQTRTAAKIIEKRKGEGDIHQYFPFDKKQFVNAFLDHWQPDAAFFLEGEIWINMLLGLCERKITTALLNARMTSKTIRSWLSLGNLSQKIFSSFTYIHSANSLCAEAINEFGFVGNVKSGNLKSSSPAPKIDENTIQEFLPLLKNRQVWLAASTHTGEDEIILKAQDILSLTGQNPLLILAPRHLERTEGIVLIAQKMGFKTARRSLNQMPSDGIGVYFWDTMGELANAYRLAPVSLVCGSLVRGIGGHNPIEPAQLGSAIISGAYVHNFADIFKDLENINAAVMVYDTSPQQIAMKIADLLFDKKETSAMCVRAQNYLQASQSLYKEVFDDVYNLVKGIKT
jgi:3-deoxy-D-manno-octulosonic-acid transferase